MRQTSLLILLFLGILSTATAQVTIKGGVNFANMLFEEKDEDIEDLIDNGSPKLMGGLGFLIPISGAIALQPEVLYVRKGSERNYTSAGQSFTNNITYDYIDIPVLLRLSLGDTYGEGLGVFVNGGAYAGYALGGKSKNQTPIGETETKLSFDDQDEQQRLDFGFALGGGLTLGNLLLEVRYVHGTNNLLDDDANNSNDGGFSKLQHRGLNLMAGITF